MIFRSPGFIYKPCCCVATSTFYQHLPSFWQPVRINKFHSTFNNVKLQQSSHFNLICKTDFDLTAAIETCNKFDFFNAAEFIGNLHNNKNNYQDHRRNQSSDSFSNFLPPLYPQANVFNFQELQAPRESKINVFPMHSNSDERNIKRQPTEYFGIVNYNGNHTKNNCEQQQDDGKKYWKDETKNKKKSEIDGELPSEIQLDEMMCYFYEQAPKLFSLTGWSYSKCSYKISFENMLLGTKTDSLNAYIMQINIMKNITKVILSEPELSIIKMTKDLEKGALEIRWQVQGVPRYVLPFSMLGLINETRSIRFIDGFSIFYVKNDGLYHRHLLLKMTPLRSGIRRTSHLPGQVLPEFHGIYRCDMEDNCNRES